MLLLGLAMVLKMGMKAVTQEPRPYTELMTQSLLLPNAGHFYKLAQPKQEALMLAMEESEPLAGDALARGNGFFFPIWAHGVCHGLFALFW